jgi:multidrug transporter EmrE-like cation transporter
MALNFVIVVMIAIAAFGEGLNASKIVGLLIVCSGLVVIAQGT